MCRQRQARDTQLRASIHGPHLWSENVQSSIPGLAPRQCRGGSKHFRPQARCSVGLADACADFEGPLIEVKSRNLTTPQWLVSGQCPDTDITEAATLCRAEGAQILVLPKFWLFDEINKAVSRTHETKQLSSLNLQTAVLTNGLTCGLALRYFWLHNAAHIIATRHMTCFATAGTDM